MYARTMYAEIGGPSHIARALLAVALSVCCACSGGGAGSPGAAGRAPAISQVPGLTPAPSVNGLFRNLDPKYHRAGYIARLRSLVLGATWLVAHHPVVPLTRVAPDPRPLPQNERP